MTQKFLNYVIYRKCHLVLLPKDVTKQNIIIIDK